MARPIDADALFAEFENVDWYNNADRDEIAELLVLQAPTIDAVSVVRCRECIHFDGFNCNRFGEPAECSNPCSDDGNDFCSYGERKE